MTPEQITLVRTSFKLIAPLKEDVVRIFYQRLFEQGSYLKPLYKSCDMDAHYNNMLTMLTVTVNGLYDLESVMGSVKSFGQRSVKYSVKEKDYKIVGEAFMWTLQQCLDKEFTPDVEDAWLLVYDLLSAMMKSTESKAA